MATASEKLPSRQERGADGAPPPGAAWGLAEGDEIVRGRSAVRLLGGGERYETYLAWDERLLSLVVVKLVRPNLVGDEHALRGLAAEAELLERLRHPVIVRGFGAVLEGRRPHVVLEHLEGPRLSTLIRKQGALEPEQLLPLALQLCSALHYLAAEGLVHLDVKPTNVIMGAPARLIDLSIVRTVAELERVDHRIGTDSYMAPRAVRSARPRACHHGGRRLGHGRDALPRRGRAAPVSARRARGLSPRTLSPARGCSRSARAAGPAGGRRADHVVPRARARGASGGGGAGGAGRGARRRTSQATGAPPLPDSPSAPRLARYRRALEHARHVRQGSGSAGVRPH